MDKTELRLDPLSRDWTIFNEDRAQPPSVRSRHADELAASPFTAGAERYAPNALHHLTGEFGWKVRVVPNRLPVLRVEGDATPHSDGIYEHLDAVGAHEVVIEDPGDRHLEDMPPADIAHIIRAWALRIEDLMRDMRLRSFTVFKSTGAAAGQTVAHSLSQIVAMAVVPPALRRQLRHAREHFSVKKRCLFEDVLEHERRAGVRIVHENSDFVVFCPYASRVPFELALWPRRQNPDFHRITDEESASLAHALRLSLRKLNHALDHPACHLMLTTAPSRVATPEDWTTIEEDFRWHIAVTPALHPPSTLELATGCHVNGIWPEVAADMLRSIRDDI